MSKFRNIKLTINAVNPEFSNIIELIFSFLLDRKKLRIINYNRKLQNLIKVNIEDYKKRCGRFKVGKRNGKGREYSLATHNWLFEGEYLNGKRNGKGKYYYENGSLHYEGEFKNNKLNGKGKEYNLLG